MSKRWCYPGRILTKKDNPRLPYPIRVLPDGACYTESSPTRRLNSFVTRAGLAINTLAEVELLLTRSGVLLVGDEILRGKKDEPKAVEEVKA